jgi:hypothetical protein
MILYIALAFLALFLNFIQINNKYKYYLLFSLSALTLISRFDVGQDYLEFSKGADLASERDIEYSWILICKFFTFLNLQTFYVISFYSLLSMLFLHLIIKKLNYSLNFLYVYLFFPHFYLQSFNLIRSWLAVLIVWYIFIVICLKEKNNIKLLLSGLLSFIIHYSSIFSFIFIFFKKIKVNFLLKFLFLLIFELIFFKFMKNLSYSHYMITDQVYNYNLLIFLFSFYMFLFWFKFKIGFNFIREFVLYAILTILVEIFYSISAVSLYRPVYFILFVIPLWFSINAELNINLSKIKYIFSRFFMPFYFVYFTYKYGNLYKLVPYQSILKLV